MLWRKFIFIDTCKEDYLERGDSEHLLINNTLLKNVSSLIFFFFSSRELCLETSSILSGSQPCKGPYMLSASIYN